MNDRCFWGLPMCLETPKEPDLKEDVENLTLLRSKEHDLKEDVENLTPLRSLVEP